MELIERLRQSGGISVSYVDITTPCKRSDVDLSASSKLAPKAVPLNGIVIEAGKS